MSEIRHIETQCIASPHHGMTIVAVLCEAPDGWRCYEAAHLFDVTGDWEAQKGEAVQWTQRHGNKVPRDGVRKYFHVPDDMEFAR